MAGMKQIVNISGSTKDSLYRVIAGYVSEKNKEIFSVLLFLKKDCFFRCFNPYHVTIGMSTICKYLHLIIRYIVMNPVYRYGKKHRCSM